MACLFKKEILIRDPKTGQRVKAKSKKWWGRFRDENGRERRMPLARDKIAAQAMLYKLIVKAERKAAGLTDPFEESHKRPLLRHLDEFINYLENKDSSKPYVKTTRQRIHAILEECKFTRIDEISGSRVQTFLSDLRGTGRSIASSNHYLRAIKMFMRWLVQDRRAADDRLAHLSQMNVNLDHRRIRRPLSMEEFVRLLKAAQSGPKIQRLGLGFPRSLRSKSLRQLCSNNSLRRARSSVTGIGTKKFARAKSRSRSTCPFSFGRRTRQK
jgi:hypothetical protein